MLYAWQHVETDKAVGGVGAHGLRDSVVIVNGVDGRDGGIGPAVIDDEFAATGLKGFEIRVGGVELIGHFGVGGIEGGGRIGFLIAPGRVIENHVALEAFAVEHAGGEAGFGACDPSGPTTTAIFATGFVARINRFAFGVAGAVIDVLERNGLRGGEAFCRVGAFADDGGGVKVASGGIAENAVFQTVGGVTGGEYGFSDGGNFFFGDVARRVFEHGLGGGVKIGGEEMGPKVSGRAGEDAVVIVGKALGFHERLAAAVGTTGEVGVFRCIAIEGLDDRFGLDGHFVDGAIAEVGDFFGMAESPIGVDAIGSMAGVGGGSGVTVTNGGGHFGVVDRTGEAAVAGAAKFAVPVCRREPDFKMDFRIADRADDSADATEGGCLD